MKTNLLKFQWLFILVMGLFIVSCSDSSNSATDAESYAEETVFRTQESTNLGRFGCYELVFPVTFNFPDGTTANVDSYNGLKTLIKEWRNDNPKVRTRPSLALPYSVINAAGEVITVETVEQQKELKIACAKDFFNNHDPKGHNDRPKLCFRIQLPFSLTLPNGTIMEITSKDDLKRLHAAIKEWRKNHPDSKVRPTLVFPVTVKMEDGSLVVVNSKEELKALKESCK
jgi:hypothetical protein